MCHVYAQTHALQQPSKRLGSPGLMINEAGPALRKHIAISLYNETRTDADCTMQERNVVTRFLLRVAVPACESKATDEVHLSD